MKRFQIFALAGALTLTVFTGGAAIMGMSHGGTAKPGAPAVATQVVSPAALQRGDD
jgi:hypothetical protein